MIARSRSGTTRNQTARPSTSAASAPREYDSIMHTNSTPRAGHASAFAAAWPDRRAASHSIGGTPSAAIRPTEFQYANGSRSRAYVSSGASAAGKTLVSSAHAQTSRQPAPTPTTIPAQRSGSRRASATPPANTAR